MCEKDKKMTIELHSEFDSKNWKNHPFSGKRTEKKDSCKAISMWEIPSLAFFFFFFFKPYLSLFLSETCP